MTADLNHLDTEHPGVDKDFIIQNGRAQKDDAASPATATIEERLSAAGIEVATENTADAIGGTGKGYGTGDTLLAEIDEFRLKAETIQNKIREKEARVSELESLLQKKETANAQMQNRLAELETELSEKQQEADGLVTSVERQVDKALCELRGEMNTLQSSMEDSMQKVLAESQNDEEASRQSEELQARLEDTVNNVSQSLEGVKTELFDKVHNENVKVYRNIQDLLNERDQNDTSLDITKDQFKKMGSRITFSTVLLVLNLGVAVAILLALLGII